MSGPSEDIERWGRLVGGRLQSEISDLEPPRDLLARAHRRHNRYRKRRQRTVLIALCAGVIALLALTFSVPAWLSTGPADNPPAATLAPAPTVSSLTVVNGPWSPWRSTVANNRFTVGACPPQGDLIGVPGVGASTGDCDGVSRILRTDKDPAASTVSWHFLLPEKPAHCTIRLYIPDSDMARGQARYDLYPYDAALEDTKPGTWSFGLHQSHYRGKWIEYGVELSLDGMTKQITMRLSSEGRDSTVLIADVAQLRCTHLNL